MSCLISCLIQRKKKEWKKENRKRMSRKIIKLLKRIQKPDKNKLQEIIKLWSPEKWLAKGPRFFLAGINSLIVCQLMTGQNCLARFLPYVALSPCLTPTHSLSILPVPSGWEEETVMSRVKNSLAMPRFKAEHIDRERGWLRVTCNQGLKWDLAGRGTLSSSVAMQ